MILQPFFDPQGWWSAAPHYHTPNYTVPDTKETAAKQRISLVVIHCISLPPWPQILRYSTEALEDSLVHRLFMNQINDPDLVALFAPEAVPRVSAHFYVNRQGVIAQYVSTHHIAWHAGASQFLGLEHCNEYSIGIELEGNWEDPTGYTFEQYFQCAALIRDLLQEYPNIHRSLDAPTTEALPGLCAQGYNIAAHSEVSPGRKSDPGPYWDWQQLLKLLSR